jgi:CRISPR type I-E-associated protein CasB/Cse2
MSTTNTPPSTPLAARVSGTVLALRDLPNHRPDLRRGHSRTTDRFAVPHVARLWLDAPWHRTPILRFAALAATHTDVSHDRPSPTEDGPGRRPMLLGQFLALTAHADGSYDRIGKRVVWVQTGDVEKFHVAIRNAMPRRVTSGPRSVSWFDIADLYLRWDHPDRTVRRNVRQRLLDSYFQTTSANSLKGSK